MKEKVFLRAGEPADVALQSQTSPSHHILMAEDDPDLRQFNSEALLRSGYNVDLAEDGAAAWQALNADSYDLLITDNNMPKVSGVELLKKLHAAHMALPVIMATGTLPEHEFAASPWLIPDATLLKPYTIGEMLGMVKNVLREADVPAAAPLQHPTRSLRRILVVDENHDLRQLYAEALGGLGYHVDAAEDGAAGWAALQANRYHLLITEHDLPKLSGVEMVRKLRAAHMALPVVMAAGRLPTDQLAQNPALQLAATLAKPFTVDMLLGTVKEALRPAIGISQPIVSPDWQSGPSADGLRL